MTYGPYDALVTDLEGGVLTVHLNRPARLNAYTTAMGLELRDVFERADADDAVRVVITTGEGRAFCAGADLAGGDKTFVADAPLRRAGEARPENRFVDAIFRCRKPSIAAINGHAVGVGVTMTLPMDVRIVSAEAKLGLPFARRGLILEAGAAWFLPRIVGLPTALRWCLEAPMLTAQDALAAQLVSEVVAPEDVLTRAKEIARRMIDGTSPVAVALMRQLIYQGAGETLPMPILDIDASLNRELGIGADAREGIAAFLEKRPPDFPGRPSRDMPQAWRLMAASALGGDLHAVRGLAD